MFVNSFKNTMFSGLASCQLQGTTLISKVTTHKGDDARSGGDDGDRSIINKDVAWGPASQYHSFLVNIYKSKYFFEIYYPGASVPSR